MKNAILMTLVLSVGLLAARAPAQTAMNTEAVTLRKELADLQFAALNSAEGEARLEARRQADRAFRDAAAQQVRTLTSGGARGEAIKARLAVVAPVPAAK